MAKTSVLAPMSAYGTCKEEQERRWIYNSTEWLQSATDGPALDYTAVVSTTPWTWRFHWRRGWESCDGLLFQIFSSSPARGRPWHKGQMCQTCPCQVGQPPGLHPPIAATDKGVQDADIRQPDLYKCRTASESVGPPISPWTHSTSPFWKS